MAKKETLEIEALSLDTAEITFNVVGETPLIPHRFASKAWKELLLPSRRKNAAEKVMTLKHDPLKEYQECFYVNRDKSAPTMFHLPTGMFHQALGRAAIDIPGVAKSETLRLVSVVTPTVFLYGVPMLGMDMVRQAGMTRAPDVRTRPYFNEWALSLTFRFVRGLITERQIAHLFGAAGLIVGVADWRGEKGGSYGRFRLVEENDPDFLRIREMGGRAAQEEAFVHPAFYDDQAQDLFGWFSDEAAIREKELSSGKVSASDFGDDDEADEVPAAPKKRGRPRLAAAE